MPYLQVELDAMDKWPMVASGCGVAEATVYRGFLKLWAHCWREKTSVVTPTHLECLFEMPERGQRAGHILATFGFVEPVDGGYRVCGADKYLRITEARSRGGKKASANLKRGKSPGSSRKTAGKQPEDSPGSAPALTSNIEHHSSNKLLKSTAPADAAPPAPKSEIKALEADLVSDYSAMRPGATYKHGGAKDTEQLKAILATGMPRETVRGMWRYGLKQSGWLGINTIAQLGQKFNDLAGFYEPLPKKAAPLRPPAPENMNGAAESMGAPRAEEIPF